MKIGIPFAILLGLAAVSQPSLATRPATQAAMAIDGAAVRLIGQAPVPKSASTQTLGSRATATTSAAVFGGFHIINTTDVYILVRGNSLGTLGITQNYLDLPRVRLYNQAGQDLVTDGQGFAGFNFCDGTSPTTQQPVISFYQNVRGSPVHADDGCFAGSFAPGVYTFSVEPTTGRTFNSVPPSGEILFEVTFNP
jgi:hypothetical protein